MAWDPMAPTGTPIVVETQNLLVERGAHTGPDDFSSNKQVGTSGHLLQRGLPLLVKPVHTLSSPSAASHSPRLRRSTRSTTAVGFSMEMEMETWILRLPIISFISPRVETTLRLATLCPQRVHSLAGRRTGMAGAQIIPKTCRRAIFRRLPKGSLMFHALSASRPPAHLTSHTRTM